MDYHKITIQVLKEKVDIITAVLYDLHVEGVEVHDFTLTEEEMAEMFVDVYEQPEQTGDEISLTFYIPKEKDLEKELKLIFTELQRISAIDPLGSLEMSMDESLEEDWAHNWKKFYEPFIIDGHILIKPVWEDLNKEDCVLSHDEIQQCDIIIDIDPGLAFGSGTHETTSMCIKAIDQYVKADDTIIDIGCGSGILGIAAAKLGVSKGILIDLDEKACRVAGENVVTNKTDDVLTVVHGDLLDKVKDQAEVVVANIFADVIIAVTEDVKKALFDGGTFICSGIITERGQDVVDHLEVHGFEIIEEKNEGDWMCYVARKK